MRFIFALLIVSTILLSQVELQNSSNTTVTNATTLTTLAMTTLTTKMSAATSIFNPPILVYTVFFGVLITFLAQRFQN